MSANLKGARVTFFYKDGSEISVPVTQSLPEMKALLNSLLMGEDWNAYVALTVAGEDKETWVALEDVRAIDAEELVLAELNTENERKTSASA